MTARKGNPVARREAPTTGHPDASLLELHARALAIDAGIEILSKAFDNAAEASADSDGVCIDALSAERIQLCLTISGMEARTVEGCLAKLHWLRLYSERGNVHDAAGWRTTVASFEAVAVTVPGRVPS